MVEEFKQGKPVGPIALYIFPQVFGWQQFYSLQYCSYAYYFLKFFQMCIFSVNGFPKYMIILRPEMEPAQSGWNWFLCSEKEHSKYIFFTQEFGGISGLGVGWNRGW